jgi:sugar-specific transcriptional regulator TrmB
MAVIAAASKLNKKNKSSPTAAQIGEELKSTYPLKHSQLYATISKLSDLGFLSASFLGTPKIYRIDKETMITGSKEWLRRQRESLRSLHENLIYTIDVLEENKITDVALIIESETATK